MIFNFHSDTAQTCFFFISLVLAATTSTKVLPIAYKGCNKESLLVMAPQVKTQVG